jgi:hypothetical protein
MLSWTWAALIIVGFGVLGAVTPLLIGMFYPARSLAVMAIKRRLKASSFGPHQFSEACLQELADMSIRDAKIFGNLSRKGWRSELGQMADNTADIVGWIVLVEGDCSAEKIKSNASMGGAVWQILAKHDKRFSLDHLQFLQDNNVLLLQEIAAAKRRRSDIGRNFPRA